MRTLITNYTFNAAAKTVAFTDYVTIPLEKVLEVLNKTRGVKYYNPEDPLLLGTVAANVLTFVADTTGHADGDVLEIWYEPIADTSSLSLPTGAATSGLQTTGNTSLSSMDGKLPALIGGRIPVELPPGASGLTDAELRAAAVLISAAALPLPAGAAEQATLALLLAKVIAAPSTEAKQDAIITILNALGVDQLAGNALLTSIAAEDFATQTTLAAVLAKIITAPSTEAKQDAIITLLNALGVGQVAGNALLTSIAAKDFATQATLAALLAKVIAAPSTEAKQDTQITALGTLATQATAAAILAKIIAAPATEAKQDIANALLAPNTHCVSETGLTGTGVTATLPAVAGAFHYIDYIETTSYATVARVGGAVPVIITTTNLPGPLAITHYTAQAVGTSFIVKLETPRGLRSSVAGTDTTIVCPATLSVIWRVQVFYRTSP